MKKELLKWTAWVNVQAGEPSGMMHVQGELRSDGEEYCLMVAVKAGSNPNILMLEIMPPMVVGHQVSYLSYQTKLKSHLRYQKVQLQNPPMLLDVKTVSKRITH